MNRVLQLKETEIHVPAMSDYLSVDNAAEANSHTYVYEPNKSLHQMTIEAFPSHDNYNNPRNLADVFNRPTIEQLMEGKKGADGVDGEAAAGAVGGGDGDVEAGEGGEGEAGEAPKKKGKVHVR